MTASQNAVLSVLGDYGPLPDHALVPMVQHVAGQHYSSSRIRTARNELVAAGKVEDTGQEIKMPSGRMAAIWGVK